MRYGLIGEKLGHSFSKIIHEQLADYTYDLIPLTRDELDTFLREKQFAALNVTIPYKETVIPYLDEVDSRAQRIGAVNTVVNRNGRLCGYNTDFYGFRYLLQKNGIDVAGKKALVLGKGGASKALSAHHERTKDSYASNPDIDLSRTAQNFHLVTPRWSYEQEIKHRIQTAGCRVRKDSVKFVDTLVTVSPEFAKAHEAEMPEYFRRAFDFLKERVGEENIISAVVHMDEKAPHMHLCFVPLTRDKRLSAKEILGNKKSMIRWQDDFYACMAERWPELERGTPAVETRRKHLTPQWYKKVTAMDAKLEQLEATLNNINVFNAGKKREEAVALLAQLLPEVESFQAETQRLRDMIASSRLEHRSQQQENAELRKELNKERDRNFEQNVNISALTQRCKRAEKLLEKVPPEVLEHIKRKATARER